MHVPVDTPTRAPAVAQNPVPARIIPPDEDDLVIGGSGIEGRSLLSPPALALAGLLFGEDAAGIGIPAASRTNPGGYGTERIDGAFDLVNCYRRSGTGPTTADKMRPGR